ncbi:hypothetical protein KIW84_014208 [Lathyrus oleraceus]|uniref:DUF4283 domain-containing protein n=1 Tax=Pisum sativum TaxID=3888 RepID=A0A9D5BMP9_PEA|nr:hypothetical protein KIW84_014208 [Pisum sativum]
MDGPWLIYDHYLLVREWTPNFYPDSDVIEQVTVCVRVSKLPIEYYDMRVPTFIGNRIGAIVKMDINTLSRERGKYVRLCVQVSLTKLEMFAIKGRHYKIEYEGFKGNHAAEGLQKLLDDGSEHVANVVKKDGPWITVQKFSKQSNGNELEMKKGGNTESQVMLALEENDFGMDVVEDTPSQEKWLGSKQ